MGKFERKTNILKNMGSKKRENPYLDSWRETLKDKTKEELVDIVNHSGKYAPEFVEMVKEKLKKEFDTIVEEPKDSYTPEQIKEIDHSTDKLVSDGKTAIVLLALGSFAFLCVFEAIDKFSNSFSLGDYLNGGWWAFLAFCSVAVIVIYLIIKLEDLRKTERGFPVKELKQETRRGDFLGALSWIGCKYNYAEDDAGIIHFEYKGVAFVADLYNSPEYLRIVNISVVGNEYADLNAFDEANKLWSTFGEEDICNSVLMICTMSERQCELKVSCVQKMFLPIDGRDLNLENHLKLVLNELIRVHSIVQDELRKLKQEVWENNFDLHMFEGK